MVHVPYRAHIHVRLGPLKFALGHHSSSSILCCCGAGDHGRQRLIHGAHGADRTRDLSLTKGVLYH
jgi:hypothetical protein